MTLDELLELAQARLRSENSNLREKSRSSFSFENIIGKSPAIKKALVLVSKFGAHNSPVLILGDTGTGKELTARAIHDSRPGRLGVFEHDVLVVVLGVDLQFDLLMIFERDRNKFFRRALVHRIRPGLFA